MTTGNSQAARSQGQDLAAQVAGQLPYLRRHARAVTGNQDTGDRYAAAALEAIVADPALLGAAPDPRIALFRTFHRVWASAGSPLGKPDTPLSARAQARMAALMPHSREALLLKTIEGFSDEEIGAVLDMTAAEAAELVRVAREEMRRAVAGRVMIIEDEPIIALDIRTIVEEMGHAVTGVARTHRAAVELATREMPDLILADIQLADNSSGIDAVNDILQVFDALPVIFITAFPERLLTGARPEPAFVITKPYSEDQLRSAVSQAMFFASTETLSA
ncbi:MAG: response regulator [Alphaproteobacteria bacterium]|nr:MAG: response regulator [Alphaproteobacteria bacterium]